MFKNRWKRYLAAAFILALVCAAVLDRPVFALDETLSEELFTDTAASDSAGVFMDEEFDTGSPEELIFEEADTDTQSDPQNDAGSGEDPQNDAGSDEDPQDDAGSDEGEPETDPKDDAGSGGEGPDAGEGGQDPSTDAQSVEDAAVAGIENCVYNGKEQLPSPVVTLASEDGEIVLVENTDYTLEYENNVNAGTAILRIKGTGSYTGEKSVEFEIEKAPLSSMGLKYSKKTYTGSKITQSGTLTVNAVLDGESLVLTRNQDYTVSYKNNIKVGKATVTATGKGNYKGTLKKSFSIIPKKTGIKSLKIQSGKLRVTWKKQNKQITGYQIQYSTSSKFPSGKVKSARVKNLSQVSKSISGLKNNTKYYFRIRTYKTVNGKNYNSAWSAVKSIRFVLNVVTVSGSGTSRKVVIKNPSSTASGLKAAVWSEKNGKDDLAWYSMKKQSNGTYKATINAAMVGNSGKCHIYIYNGKNKLLKKSSCSFTEKELKDSGGRSKIHRYAKAILASTGNSLRGAYNWAVSQIHYQNMVVPMTLPKSGPYSVFTRQELYFVYAYESHKGNCFCYAATFYWCAKELGYNARLIEGQCQYSNGSYGAHSWVEIDISGQTYIFDPEIQYEKGWDGYYKTYANGPNLGYRKIRPY